MPQIMINGVIWSDEENKIVKHGIALYGENKWDRAIHLLPGKTLKQCRDRINAMLQPKIIAKPGWTEREDNRMLYLATVIPGEWKIIAGIVQRSVRECSIRYTRLLRREAAKTDEPKEIFNAETRGRSSSSATSNGVDRLPSIAQQSFRKKQRKMQRQKNLGVNQRLVIWRERCERIRAERFESREHRWTM